MRNQILQWVLLNASLITFFSCDGENKIQPTVPVTAQTGKLSLKIDGTLLLKKEVLQEEWLLYRQMISK
jgi:hypothetical protein